MSPRIVEAKRCPHCKAQLPEPTPRVCPACAGSLQKRFLSLGCFTTAPPIVLALVGAGMLIRRPAESPSPGDYPSAPTVDQDVAQGSLDDPARR